jgi:hypothetical protein
MHPQTLWLVALTVALLPLTLSCVRVMFGLMSLCSVFGREF